jgi:hypothetical protein
MEHFRFLPYAALSIFSLCRTFIIFALCRTFDFWPMPHFRFPAVFQREFCSTDFCPEVLSPTAAQQQTALRQQQTAQQAGSQQQLDHST